jgi:MFS family permease
MVLANQTDSTPLSSPQRKKIFYGWWIAIVAAVLRFFSGGSFYYGFSVFFNPIRDTFQWSAAETSVAFTLRSVETGVFSPIVGTLADKLAPRKLMIIGWSIIGLGFILMSRISSLWTFYGCFMLTAVGMSLGTGLVMNTTIANWFTRKRSRALTITFIGPGMSGLLAPLFAFSVGSIGWRQSLLVMGIALWVIGIPLSLFFRDRPANYGYLPDGDSAINSVNNKQPSTPSTGFTVREALKTRSFWMMSLSQLFQQMGTSAVAVHIVPYLESVGVPTAIAAVSVTGLTICSLIGRLGFGFWGDFANKRYIMTLSIGLQVVGLIAFSMITENNIWLLGVFLLTYGPGFGGPIPLWPGLQADYFGTKHFGTIMGLLTLTSVIGGLASPIVAGRIFDVMGNYKLAWQIATIVTLPAIPLMLLALPPKRHIT